MNTLVKVFEFLFNTTIFDNSLLSIAIFGIILLLGVSFKRSFSKILSRVLYRLLRKYSSELSVDKFFQVLHKPIRLFFLLNIGYIAFNVLHFPAEWKMLPSSEFGIKLLLAKGYQFALLFSVIRIAVKFIEALGMVFIARAKKNQSKSDIQLVPFLVDSAKVLTIIFGSLVILGSVFELNITGLIAGLGIGGLAIALAAQDTLSNLLGSFTIFLDKPFVVGDTIKILNTTGVVEKIGFRSTRIRTPEKSYVTIPNKKLIEGELDNLSLRTIRRVLFSLKLSSHNDADKLREMVAKYLNILEQHSQVTGDMFVKFEGFADKSFHFQVQYFVDSVDGRVYLDVREELNFKLLEIMSDLGVKMAE